MSRLVALAMVVIAIMAGCAPTRQAEAAALTAANVAIVQAAQDTDRAERAGEAACGVLADAEIDACVAGVRARYAPALTAYDAWRVAWLALKAAWNSDASDTDVARAAAAAESARAAFWLAGGAR